MKNKPTSTMLEKISHALRMASISHCNQLRKSDKSPYVNHLIEVMDLLIRVGRVNKIQTIVAGILHDSLEDTTLKPSDIKKAFGQKTLNLVIALSDDKAQSLENRRQKSLIQLESSNKAVKTIKLADICSNVTALPACWNVPRLASYFEWTDQVAILCSVANPLLFTEYKKRRNAPLTLTNR